MSKDNKKNNTKKINSPNTLKYWEENTQLKKLYEWASKGLTNTQIAINIGVHRTTFSTWANSSENIGNTLTQAREVVATEVENALVKNAKGHITTIMKSVKQTKTWYEDGKRCSLDEWIQVPDEVYTPPNAQSQIFYLKNKRSDQFKDKVEHANTFANVTIVNDLDGVDKEKVKEKLENNEHEPS